MLLCQEAFAISSPLKIHCLISASHSVVPNSLWSHGLQPIRLPYPWYFPGKDTGVGCHWIIVPNIYSLLSYFQIRLESLNLTGHAGAWMRSADKIWVFSPCTLSSLKQNLHKSSSCGKFRNSRVKHWGQLRVPEPRT